jgi:spermidine/putrescine transport system permease protein
MLRRLRERKGLQGTLLASPAIIWMLVLLIIPLLLVVVTSFGGRDPDGNVIYKFSFDNYLRLAGVPSIGSDPTTGVPLYGFDPNCAPITWPILGLILLVPIVLGALVRVVSKRVQGESRGAVILRRSFKPYVLIAAAFWVYVGVNVYSACADALYVGILGRSLELAFWTTVLVIVLGYPLAYFIARAAPKRRNLLLFLVLIPLWTNFVIRVYAWIIILRESGVLNGILATIANALPFLGPFKPTEILYTQNAVLIGMIYEFLPFMILPMFTSLEKIEVSLYEAAADLGAGTLQTFLRVTLPLSLPGMVAGTILVFVPVMGTFIVSDILGGRQIILVGNLIQRQFLDARDPAFGSAASIILMVLTLIITIYYTRRFGFGEEVTAA